ncbi:MAG: epoxyqueuosine reductase QueH [Clostridia bacterium]
MKQKLLLHSCCAPCSSSVIEKLEKDYEVTIFYYNPNIFPFEEYVRRRDEQIRFVHEKYPNMKLIIADYDNDNFEKLCVGHEKDEEGGLRCEKCFYKRLLATAQQTKQGYDIFATTLTVSPHKNFETINVIGNKIAEETNTKYLPSNFKKEDGYLRSLQLSKEYNLFRQTYCGCKYSIHKIKE